jgi:hypothetical protein
MAVFDFLRSILAVFGMLGVTMGLVALLVLGHLLRRRRLQRTWAPVAGFIRAVEVRDVFQTDSANEFCCDVSLDYVWQGQPFASGVLIEGGKSFPTRAEAEEFARNFTLGQEETIFVNTSNPTEAVARRASEPELHSEIAICAKILVVSGLLLYLGWGRWHW